MAAESLEALVARIEAPLRRCEAAFDLPPAFTPAGIRAHRKSLGLSQQGLSDKIGMSARHIGSMERGAAAIERRTALAIVALHFEGES